MLLFGLPVHEMCILVDRRPQTLLAQQVVLFGDPFHVVTNFSEKCGTFVQPFPDFSTLEITIVITVIVCT